MNPESSKPDQTPNQPISVWLAGRSYRILIRPEEEPLVREALNQAEERIRVMRSQYAGKDDQDFISMTLISYAVEHQLEQAQKAQSNEDLKALIHWIDESMNGKQVSE